MAEAPPPEARILGEVRAASVRRRRRTEPVPALASAAAAAVVVALGASAMAAAALALTFLVFLLVDMTVGRRSRWSAILPFTRVAVGLLHRATAAIVVWLLAQMTAMAHISVPTLILATVVATATSIIARRLAAPAPKRIAVIGSARAADQLRRELLGSRINQQVVGVVAPGPGGDMPDGGVVPVLGGIAALAEVLQQNDVDTLLIDREASRVEVFDQLAATCLDLPVRVCELAQFYEDALGHVPVSEIGSAWFRYIMHPRFRSPDSRAQRVLDVVVALLAGAVLLPVIGVCALLIKLQDGGPVLFRQRRIGSRGHEFTLIKLRTMRAAAPAEARWSPPGDERVTPIGRLLRRTHLDEIPQLLNVLRGEMSVVGPRPEQPQFVEQLEQTLPHYSRRHLIKPGMTGWAQVRCGYASSEAGSAWKLCHDLFYLKHHSLALDLAILVETACILMTGRQFPGLDEEGVLPVVAVATGDPGALVPRTVPAN